MSRLKFIQESVHLKIPSVASAAAFILTRNSAHPSFVPSLPPSPSIPRLGLGSLVHGIRPSSVVAAAPQMVLMAEGTGKEQSAREGGRGKKWHFVGSFLPHLFLPRGRLNIKLSFGGDETSHDATVLG